MKRVLTLFLAIVLSLSAVTVFADESGFTDIKGHWAEKDIEFVAGQGIIKGVSATEFAPEKKISRAEFLALIIRAMDEGETKYQGAYADVKATDWYAGVVQTGKNIGIIPEEMTPGNEFSPTAPINREEMTALIIHAYSLKVGERITKADISVFTDKDEISTWARGYVSGAYGLAVVKGVTEDTFSPKGNVTRAQAATIIKRFMEFKKPIKSIKILTIGNTFSTDSCYYLYSMLKSDGYEEIKLGIMYFAGRELREHHRDAMQNSAVYTYKLNENGSWINSEEWSLANGLAAEKWDYVIIQNASADAARTETDPGFGGKYLDELIDYIKTKCSNPKVKVGHNMSWAFQEGSDHVYFDDLYNSDQSYMYTVLSGYCKNYITNRKDIDVFIPTGTAVQNARTSIIGDDLTRDTYHLNDFPGRYIASLTMYSAITGNSPDKLNYVPAGAAGAKLQAAKEAVQNAISSPLEVTNSQILSE